MQALVIKTRIKLEGEKAKMSVKMVPLSTPIFDLNISKLGLLGASVASDVITVYSRTKATFSMDELPLDLALHFYESGAKGYEKWATEIEHVAKRLGNWTDPGSLHEVM
jgi:hypothetical protein